MIAFFQRMFCECPPPRHPPPLSTPKNKSRRTSSSPRPLPSNKKGTPEYGEHEATKLTPHVLKISKGCWLGWTVLLAGTTSVLFAFLSGRRGVGVPGRPASARGGMPRNGRTHFLALGCMHRAGQTHVPSHQTALCQSFIFRGGLDVWIIDWPERYLSASRFCISVGPTKNKKRRRRNFGREEWWFWYLGQICLWKWILLTSSPLSDLLVWSMTAQEPLPLDETVHVENILSVICLFDKKKRILLSFSFLLYLFSVVLFDIFFFKLK